MEVFLLIVSIIGLVLVILAVVFGLVFGPVVRRLNRNRLLLRQGTAAPATILSLAPTGVRINYKPMVRFRLEVRPDNTPPFQAEARMLIDSLQVAQYQVGTVVEVRYDPSDPQQVVIGAVLGSAGLPVMAGIRSSQPQMDQQQAIEMWQRLEGVNKAILATGLAAPATILNSWDLGMRIYNDAPLMGFLLQVRPATQAPFQAEAKEAIAQMALLKYQVGQVVQVKYDPADNTKVALYPQ